MIRSGPDFRAVAVETGRAKRHNVGMRRILLVLLFAVSFAGGFVSCETNKQTGRRQLLLFSEDRMAEMGVEAYQQMTAPSEVTLATDPRLTEPLQRVGRAIADAANKPEYKWEFKLIQADTVNAWALPGGKIAFYTGIYPILQDEAGMAIVMGHEVMHAILQHGNERMSQTSAAQVLLAGASIASEGSEYNSEIMAALGAGAQFGVLLPYSRKHESEADRYGLMLAARAGYDPEAAIGVWQRMAEMSEGQRPPEFMSTHPDPLNRVEAMKKWMPEAKRLYEQSQKMPNRPLPAVR